MKNNRLLALGAFALTLCALAWGATITTLPTIPDISQVNSNFTLTMPE
jgi:hypothetical protein